MIIGDRRVDEAIEGSELVHVIPDSFVIRMENMRAIDMDIYTFYLFGVHIFDEEITPSMFRELYFLRWACEKKYYELKITSLLEEFSSATPNSMMQEFFITLLLTNLSALVKADADEEIKIKSRPKNKFNYQANRIFLFCHIKLNLIA